MAAAAPSAVMQEKGATAIGCSDGKGAGCGAGDPEAAGAAPSVAQEIIAVECSDVEEDGSGATNNDDKSNDAGDKTDKFVADGPVVPAPSVRSDLRAKAVADVSFAFSAFAGGGTPQGFTMVSAGSFSGSRIAASKPRAGHLERAPFAHLWPTSNSG